jgi:hypothetical protein
LAEQSVSLQYLIFQRLLDLIYSPLSALNEAKRKILCGEYISYIFHVFSEAKDHILILNILFFNKLRQTIPEIRSERRDLLIFIFILKTTGTFTPVHSAGYLIA